MEAEITKRWMLNIATERVFILNHYLYLNLTKQLMCWNLTEPWKLWVTMATKDGTLQYSLQVYDWM